MSAITINIKEKDKILIIAPHPDDECIGCGGLLSLYPEKCSVVVMTDGSQGNINVKPEQEKNIRKIQFVDEMEKAGITDYLWLGYPDGKLMSEKNCAQKIKFENYSKIFLPWRDDNHPDHTAAFVYSLEAIKKIILNGIEIYEYEVHVPFHDVTHYLDITDTIQFKEQLIRCHKDQMQNMAYDKQVESLAKYRACQLNKSESYYETYRKLDFSNENKDEIEIVERERTIQKYKMFYSLFSKWIELYQTGDSLDDWFKQRQVNSISIYGYARVGKLLVREIQKHCSDITIVDIFDRRKLEPDLEDINIVEPQYGNRNVDLVIVTALYDYNEIENDLRQYGFRAVVSLQDIIDNI